MGWTTRNGKHFYTRSNTGPSLTDLAALQNQDKHRQTVNSIRENEKRKSLQVNKKVVEKNRELGFRVGLLGNSVEYKIGKKETITKEKS